MYTEEEFIKKVKTIHGDKIEVIGRFKGVNYPILFKTKYGICLYKTASTLFENKLPSIKIALNKTEYFMNQLKDKYPEIAELIIPKSEYESAKKKMLFENKFGIVAISPDALLSGHCPNIRSAVDRKQYFKNQLLYLYDNKYDFNVTSTDRHKGTVDLICPIHGIQKVDTDGIFLGHGCPECNQGWTKSNVFYLIKLFNDNENFYKLGISYIDSYTKNVKRFRDYKKLKYNIEILKVIEFEDFVLCRDFETEMKRIIKNSIYMPNKWANDGTTECFKDEILPLILNKIKEYDIVSTSSESLSSQLAE